MRRMRFMLVLALLAVSCRPKGVMSVVSGYDPALGGAVFTATLSPSESADSPVEQNRTNEDPPRYGARLGLGNGSATVGYQYVGRAQVDQTSLVDVYLVSVKIGTGAKEYVPVVYAGGEETVGDRPEVKISFRGGVAPSRNPVSTTTRLPRWR
jgi:hypothetical protein